MEQQMHSAMPLNVNQRELLLKILMAYKDRSVELFSAEQFPKDHIKLNALHSQC